MNSASNGDFMTQTTDGAFELIENMAATSANKNEESDCSKKGNSSDTQKMDELTAKVDQLLKNNQGHVFSMDQATAGQIQNQNQQQPQSNRQAVPATGNSQPDELKGLGMMMQQMLQGMQIHGKALNHVSTDINTMMDNMFTELNTKNDIVSNHIKRIDVQLAQTTKSVKSQQGTLPGNNVMNPKVGHCNAAELRCEKSEGKEPEQLSAETAPGAEERTEQPASSEVTAPSEPAETPPGEIKEVLDGDPHTDTKKLSGNARVKEKVQKKRVKGDPMMTLIPHLCDEKSIEYEVKCNDHKSATPLASQWLVENSWKFFLRRNLVKRVRSKKFWMEILTLIPRNSVGMQG
ncbi:hypothetical protein F2Q69_00027075 [Brassica cretica]|uniref:Uncharacterized protein n=2 Tax=Brassica cretica TaxID=69181 RepID=A0A8S9RXV4_BRACR|nr:hypothetical protein F2Q69_00027075 [Brassica cretica]